jgi:hypothetical protein
MPPRQRREWAPASNRGRSMARAALLAVVVFSTTYIGYSTFSAVTASEWTSNLSRPLVVAALVLSTLACVEVLVLGLNTMFLQERLVPPKRRQIAYVVVGSTVVAALVVAFLGDARFAVSLGSLIVPVAAIYGIVVFFSASFTASQDDGARGRNATRSASSGAGTRASTAARGRQRKRGRRRH